MSFEWFLDFIIAPELIFLSFQDKSENSIRKLLEDGTLSLDKLLVESDSPFMYPNTRASKLPAHVKNGITDRSLVYLQRYCTFQRNEPCSLPAIVEMIAAFMNKTPEEVALASAFNALKLFGLSQWGYPPLVGLLNINIYYRREREWYSCHRRIYPKNCWL